MDPKIDVLASLEAKAKETSLEELSRRGKKRLRTIRAKDVAAMIHDAIETALTDTDWVSPEKVEELVAKSKSEFERVHQEWDQERRVADAREAEAALLRARCAEYEARIEELQARLDYANQQLAGSMGGQAAVPMAPAGSGAPGAPTPMAPGQPAQPGVPMQPGAPGQQAEIHSDGMTTAEELLASKLDSIAGALDAKLEKMGKKMGISAAVGDEAADLEALFKDGLDDGDVESNIDTVELEKRESGGIAANLERIKKLKGG